MRKILAAIVLIFIIFLAGWTVFVRNKAAAPGNSNQQSNSTQTSTFDKNKYSISDPASPWLVVNKKNPLNPKTFVPADLAVANVRLRLGKTEEQMKFSAQAIPDLEAMFATAKNDGVELVFGSGYRSHALQKQFYDSYVAKDGVEKADRYSARPGHSEHQTGLAVDITRADGKCHLEECFEDTEQGKWLAANAYKYGFLLRYTTEKETVTGYQYEPWHFRYVGRELAEEMNKQNIETLEEFFNLPQASNY